MKNRKQNDYFTMLSELINYSCSAAKLLDETLRNFNPNEIEEKINELHEIEHTADVKKHDMIYKLEEEFITPIERGDIIELSHEIDNVTDSIEEVLGRIYMFNLTSMKEEALEFCTIILKITEEAKKLIDEFRNFKKSTKINEMIININDLEEAGDRLYRAGIRKFYTNPTDPIELIAWKDTFEYFEKCCDACENVADVVESVIMRNS